MYFQTQAVVLKRTRMQDSDMMITLFTQKAGVMQVVAKGARHPKSPLSAPTHPFVYGQFSISTGDSYNRLGNAEITDSFYHVREDLETLAYASYFCELTEKSMKEGQGNKNHFIQLVEFLNLLNTKDVDLRLARVAFEIKVLKSLGYGISAMTCIECGTSLADFPDATTFHFSSKGGGMLCEGCVKAPDEYDGGVRRVGRNLLQLMDYLEKKDIRIIAKTNINIGYISKLETLLKSYMGVHLQLGPLKTLMFMETMNINE